MVRASYAAQIGFLDTRFDPLYSKEVDWCFRFRKAGWKVIHLPQAHVIHLGGVTMKRASMRRLERIYEKKALFFRKHFSPATLWVYKISLFFTSLAKTLLWSLNYLVNYKNRAEIKEQLRTFWNLTRRALSL
jgi:GT2 family glycosyltransferase